MPSRNPNYGLFANKNTKVAKNWKNTQQPSTGQIEIAIGIVFSDATAILGSSGDVSLKFEQGVAQKEFVDHLFDVIKSIS